MLYFASRHFNCRLSSPPAVAVSIFHPFPTQPISSFSTSILKVSTFELRPLQSSPFRSFTSQVFTFKPFPPRLISHFSTSGREGVRFYFIEQFVPTRHLPPPPLNHVQCLQILHSLTTVVKTSGDHLALVGFSLKFCPYRLSRFLFLFREHQSALTFFEFSLRDLSIKTIRMCCIAAHELVLMNFNNSKKVLAQGILTSVIGKVQPLHWKQLLEMMRARNPCLMPYHVFLNLAFRAYLNNNMACEALEVLVEYRRVNLVPQITAITILLRMLFKHGKIHTAWKVFVDMFSRGPSPSSLTFNTMILGFCLRGRSLIGEMLLSLMPRFKCPPDACSYNMVIKSHCVSGRISDAFQLLKLMINSGCSPSIVTYNIIIHFFCQQGKMKEARLVFDDICQSGLRCNTITYNVLLDGYVKAGQINNANDAFSKMMEAGVSPDCYTHNILVSGYHKFQPESDGERFMNDVLKLEIFQDDLEFDLVISRMCWDGRVDEACLLLMEMVDYGEKPSVVAFNAVIAGYSRIGSVEKSLDVYSAMGKIDLTPLRSTYSLLLFGLCRSGRMLEAGELVDTMMEKGININKSALAMLIDGCFRIRDKEGAMKIWENMEKHEIAPDVIIFSAFINGLCITDHIHEAWDAFSLMSSKGLVPNNFTYNSLINGLFRTGNFKEAWNLEKEMQNHGLIPDIFTNNIIINCLCKQGRVKMAKDRFNFMFHKGLNRDVVTYNTLIWAYCKAFDMFSAQNIITVMTSEGCDPDIVTYNILIHSLCVSHQMSQAVKTFDKLIPIGVVPNNVTYNIMMNGICMDVLERAMILTAKLIKMACIPNVITVNLLLSHFCKQGMARRVVMWVEKLIEVSFPCNDATFRILKWAHRETRNECQISSGSSVHCLFLDFLMHITMDHICRNRPPEIRKIETSNILDHYFSDDYLTVQER